MKKFTIAGTMAVMFFAAPQAWGGLTVHDDVEITVFRSFPNGGGPFRMQLHEDNRVGQASDGSDNGAADASGFVHTLNAGDELGDPFFGFCVERNEFLASPRVYDISGLSDESMNSFRFLTGYSAFVYSMFLSSGENPTIGDATTVDPTDGMLSLKEGGLYQKAIWAGMVKKDAFGAYFIPGVDQSPNANDPEVHAGSGASLWGLGAWTNATDRTTATTGLNDADLVTLGIDYATFLSTWGSGTEQDRLGELADYEVMNVQSDTGLRRQDQIIVPPGDTGIVPEPASIVVWSLLAGSAAGLVATRKRRAVRRWSDESRQAICGVIEGRIDG